MTPTALIGYTGFVGSNILAQRPGGFDALFRSTNIAEIAGRHFELLVCAGVRAEKWRANADPAADAASLAALTEPLESVHADLAIVISTVDVFGHPVAVDEQTPITPAAHAATPPYGRHRRNLEVYFASRVGTHFGRVLIVRLPGLFGPGLKKNVIYDLAHNNLVDRIDPRCVFQFYNLANVWADIQTACAAGLNLIHFATEPVPVAELARRVFARDLPDPPHDKPPAVYDLRTRHAALFHQVGHYIAPRERILAQIQDFVTPSPPSATA